ncbi:S8 family serine peptidase [candidate division KSB1 bacterium]|nr:S8 family serine peptidase [candidate division KSB1 bacterium]
MKRFSVMFTIAFLFLTHFAIAGNSGILAGFKVSIDPEKRIRISSLDSTELLKEPVLRRQAGSPKSENIFQMARTSGTLLFEETGEQTIELNGSDLFYKNNSLTSVTGTDESLLAPDLYLYTGSGSYNSFTFNTSTNVLNVYNSFANGGNAASGAFRVGWYLSNNLVLDVNDYFVTSVTQAAGLAAGYYVNLQATADLDNVSNLQSGTYYLWIVTDDLNSVGESDETNNYNYFSSPQITYSGSGLPDLIIYTGTNSTNNFSFNSATNALTVTNSIANNGTANAGSYRVGWYLSEYTTLGISDFFIISANMSAGLQPGYFVNATANVDLDNVSGLKAGNYYLWVVADDLNNVLESDETNNANYFVSQQIFFGGTGSPDLSFYQGVGSTNGYRYNDLTKKLDVVISIGNFGQTTAPVFSTGWYISQDLVLTDQDLMVTDASTPDILLPGYYYTIESSADLSMFGSIPAGEYYLIVFIDNKGEIAESDEDNNASYFYEKLKINVTSGEPDINLQNSVLYLNPPPPGSLQKPANINALQSKRERLEVQLKAEHTENELLIKFRDTLTAEQITTFMRDHGLEVIRAYKIIPNGFYVRITDSQNVGDKARSLLDLPEVELIEPNMKNSIDAVPNDPGFKGLFGLHNTGQTGGTNDADIDAPEAWDTNTGNNNVIVGVLDSGIDYDHPDLAANMWVNPDETPNNGIDDDKNGYVDDVYGWDWAYNDNDPSDYCGHGTHVAGTVGAVGNNGEGVTGVCWTVKMMVLKYLDDEGSGSNSNAITAIEYAVANGVDVIQNSTGGGSYNTMYEMAIRNSNVLFVSSAGNDSKDVDAEPHYPGGYNCDNIITVASLDHDDYISTFSNYGATTVDLAAYGTDILSTKPGNVTDINFGTPGAGLNLQYYGVISGTSMSTPQVSGAAALLLSHKPELTWLDLKNTILDNVDVNGAMIGKCVTHGKLNIYKAITAAGTSNDTPIFIIQNNGLKKLTVSSITSDKTWLTTSGYSGTPFDINSGFFQQVQVNVDWKDAGSSPQTGTITIQSNDPDEPQVMVTVNINSGTAVQEKNTTPAVYTLEQNYPNPFNPVTTIDFSLPVRTHVRLNVYNLLGQEVALLVNEIREPGSHNVRFDASTLQSGVYLYKMETERFTRTAKMLLVK